MAVADDAVEPFISRYISALLYVEYWALSAPVMKHFADRISCRLIDIRGTDGVVEQ